MKKRFRKLLCCFLVFTLNFTSVEWSGIAQSIHSVKAEETQKETSIPEQKEVIKSEKTKNSTTFELANGKKETVFYGQDVRFEAENGKYQISFAPIYGQKTEQGEKKEDQETDIVQQAVTQAEQAVQSVADDADTTDETEDTQNVLESVDKLERTKLENAEVEDAEENKTEKPVKVSYESQQKECTFSYESLNMGMKESIVLTKAPEGNVLKFRFKMSGLIPKKNVLDGGISFLDEKTEEIVAALEAPNMNDATGKAYSEKISYDIEPDNEEEE